VEINQLYRQYYSDCLTYARRLFAEVSKKLPEIIQAQGEEIINFLLLFGPFLVKASFFLDRSNKLSRGKFYLRYLEKDLNKISNFFKLARPVWQELLNDYASKAKSATFSHVSINQNPESALAITRGLFTHILASRRLVFWGFSIYNLISNYILETGLGHVLIVLFLLTANRVYENPTCLLSITNWSRVKKLQYHHLPSKTCCLLTMVSLNLIAVLWLDPNNRQTKLSFLMMSYLLYEMIPKSLWQQYKAVLVRCRMSGSALSSKGRQARSKTMFFNPKTYARSLSTVTLIF